MTPGLSWALQVTLSGLSAMGVLGALALWWRWAADRSRGEQVGSVVLFLVAVALHWTAPWGVYDLNLRSPAAWRGFGSDPLQYGHGVVAAAAPAQLVMGSGWSAEHLPRWFGVLSALHGVLLVPIVDRFSGSRLAAWTAGIWLTVHPMAVRYGATDVQAVPEVLWTVVALLAWCRAVDDDAPGWMVFSGLAAGLAAHGRPDSLIVPALYVAAIGARAVAGERPRRAWVAVAVAVVVAMPQAVFHLGRVVQGTDPLEGLPGLAGGHHPVLVHGWRHLIALDPWMVGWAPWLALLALPWAPGSRAMRGVVLALALGLSLLVASDPTWTATDGVAIGFARHQLRALPFAAWLLGLGVAGWSRAGPRPWMGAVVAALLVGGAVARLAEAGWAPRAGQGEFRAWITARTAIDTDRLILPAVDADAGFRVPVELIGDGQVQAVWPPPDRVEAGALYWRSGECSLATVSLGLACEAFEASHQLEPIQEAWVPAGRWIYDAHRLDPVRVGLYRVLGPRSGQLGDGEDLGQGGVGIERGEERQRAVEGEDLGRGQVVP